MKCPAASGLRFGVVLAALALGWAEAPLQAQIAEAQVKAAYLFKLASFVSWPAGAPNAFRICTSGRSDIAGVLRELTDGQQVDGRSISIVQLNAGDPQRARDCQILFLGRGGETSRSLAAQAGRDAPVLTVTDRDNGTRGGIVEFVMQDGKVRFTVARREAAERRLELSSKLLDVALEVRP